MGNALSAEAADKLNWQLLLPKVRFDTRSFTETLDGGQAFRWRQLGSSSELGTATGPVFEGQWLTHHLCLRLDAAGRVEWACAGAGVYPSIRTDQTALAEYLAVDEDFASYLDALPWRSDPVINEAIAMHPRLRLLRQPLEETLLGFLCSTNKQIVQIKQMLAALARSLGKEIQPGVHALPTWTELAQATDAQLAACALGYRAKFIRDTAAHLAGDPGFFHRVHDATYDEAKALLISLPGVGPKVADCVLLFGEARHEAFPVDTWILSIMEESYGLKGWTPAQIAHFGRQHFGTHAGLAQQFLFAKARARGRGRT
ncbi:MAG: DNA-binding protein [Verrucomicrobiota bacterium]|nr:DNA-binding protein [Verrucomicrobiota bacterium]